MWRQEGWRMIRTSEALIRDQSTATEFVRVRVTSSFFGEFLSASWTALNVIAAEDTHPRECDGGDDHGFPVVRIESARQQSTGARFFRHATSSARRPADGQLH